jgi:arylsulfatase A-like enzyme
MTYHDYYDPQRSARTQTYKLIVNFSAAPSFMDPSGSWRPRSDTLVPPNPARAYHAPLELYDLEHDPGETRNLAAVPEYTSVLRDLQTRLAKHLKETQDPILNGAVTSPMHRRSLEWLES